MPDPFQNTEGIPVGQDPENLALTVARSGAARSGAARSGFIGSPGDVADVHEIGTAGSVIGAGYGWRDRFLPEPGTPPVENQPPVLTVPEGEQLTDWDTPIVFDGNDGRPAAPTIDDPDAGDLNVQLAIAVTNGVGTITLSAGSYTITAGANGSAAVTIRGTLFELNQALDGMTFTPTEFVIDVGQITFDANDLGHTGSGGAKTDSKAIDVSLTDPGD